MKVLNRAKHLYSEEYFISESVLFEYGNMFLIIDGARKECDISTRALNFSDMIDSEGNKIFASLSKDGKGGDLLNYKDADRTFTVKYDNNKIMLDHIEYFLIKDICRLKIIGIQE